MNFMQANLVRVIPMCLACAALAHAGPVTIGGLWYEFYFTGVGSQVQMCSVTNAGCVPSPSSNSSFAPDPPWTFTAPANGAILTVTDVQKPGTSFDIFDFGKKIGSTPQVSGSQEDCGIDPVPCLADPRWSHGAFTLGSGAHSITISTNASFFGQGLGYFRLDAAGAQTPAIASINAQFGNAAHLAADKHR